MRRRVIVTGSAGFTGQYVTKELEKRYEVFHLTKDGSSNSEPINLLNADAVKDLVERVQPTHAVHLAAISFVEHEDKSLMYRVNIEGTLNFLTSLISTKSIQGNVILASSANVYGNSITKRPITEEDQVNPVNDYAVSKLAMELVARVREKELPIVTVRPFNYTGIGQDSHFIIPKIVSAFKRRLSILELGNIDIYRDFSDVRDVSETYAQLIECREAIGQTYNVCSGKAYSIREIISLCEMLTQHKIEIRQNDKFLRNNEIKCLVGSNTRVSTIRHRQLRPIKETIEWMLNGEG